MRAMDKIRQWLSGCTVITTGFALCMGLATSVMADELPAEETYAVHGLNKFDNAVSDMNELGIVSGRAQVDGIGDYFTRTDGSNTAVDANDLENIQGSFWWGAQDIDGEGGPMQVTLSFVDADIRGLCNLQLEVFLAEDDASDGNEDWDGMENRTSLVAAGGLCPFTRSAAPGRCDRVRTAAASRTVPPGSTTPTKTASRLLKNAATPR